MRHGATGFALFATGGIKAQAIVTNSGDAAQKNTELLAAIARLSELGPLLPQDENGLRLPAGFR